jgi:hypothetical protein
VLHPLQFYAPIGEKKTGHDLALPEGNGGGWKKPGTHDRDVGHISTQPGGLSGSGS